MEKLQILDRNGNWHPLRSAFIHSPRAGRLVLTFWVDGFAGYRTEEDIARLLEAGYVRRAQDARVAA